MADIKSLLDDIISGDTKSSDTPASTTTVVKTITKPINFDSNNFREKLSLCVLKDIISAMMHDETKDLNCMIDDAIIRHINNDYRGTCFGYLCRARDKLQSPILGDIVQEIEDKTAETKEAVDKGEPEAIAGMEKPEIATNDILQTVSNYDELRQKLKEEVSKRVVDDVTKVITRSNDAPVFDNIDKKLKKVDNMNDEDQVSNQSDVDDSATTESVIMRMTSSIVTEQAVAGNHITTDEGINRAIITYCIGEMDALFDHDRSRGIVSRYLK